MIRMSRLVLSAIFASALLSVSAFAQTAPPSKIALVYTDAFYSDAGIKKIATAYNSLDAEFKNDFTALETLGKKLVALQAEVQSLNDKRNDPNNKVPIDLSAAQAKVDELERLDREYKFKENDIKERLARRELVVMDPITQDIAKALQEFAKQKGFTLVLDSGVLFKSKILLYSQETTDITKEFIDFYNARPA